MNKTFSQGFIHDIAELLDICIENNTDNVDLNFNFDGKMFKLNITFSANCKEKQNEEGDVNNDNT